MRPHDPLVLAPVGRQWCGPLTVIDLLWRPNRTSLSFARRLLTVFCLTGLTSGSKSKWTLTHFTQPRTPLNSFENGSPLPFVGGLRVVLIDFWVCLRCECPHVHPFWQCPKLSLIRQTDNVVSQRKTITEHINDFYNSKVEDFIRIFHIFPK